MLPFLEPVRPGLRVEEVDPGKFELLGVSGVVGTVGIFSLTGVVGRLSATGVPLVVIPLGCLISSGLGPPVSSPILEGGVAGGILTGIAWVNRSSGLPGGRSPTVFASFTGTTDSGGAILGGVDRVLGGISTGLVSLPGTVGRADFSGVRAAGVSGFGAVSLRGVTGFSGFSGE